MPRFHNDQNKILSNQFLYLLSGFFEYFGSRQDQVLMSSQTGPVPLWPLGNIQDFFMHSPYKVLQNYRVVYGNTVLFWLFRQPNVLLVHPEDIKAVLQDHNSEVYKHSPIQAAGKYFRGSVFFANGIEWENKRQQHPLSHSNITNIFNNSTDRIRNLISHHINSMKIEKKKKEILLFDEMTQLSFDIFTSLLLGQDSTSDLFKCYLIQMEDMHRKGTNPLSFPSLYLRKRTKRWYANLEQTLKNANHYKNITKVENIPHHLTDHNLINQKNFNLLRDEINTAFYAGTRNVASAISFAVQLISSHPEIYNKLQSSITDFISHHPQGYSFDDLVSLEYLDCVIKEVLRLYPTVPVFFREVLPGRALKLPSVTLPEKAQIFISSWVTHRNPELWQNPDTFLPERFDHKPKDFSYLPFGAGPRICVGMSLTLYLVKVVMIELFNALNFSSILPLETTHIDNEYFAGIIIPSDGLAIDVALNSLTKR